MIEGGSPGANSTVRDCSVSISSGAVLRLLSANHLFVWASTLVAVRFSGASVSQSGNLFVLSVQPLNEANGSDAKMHSRSHFVKIEITNFLQITKEGIKLLLSNCIYAI